VRLHTHGARERTACFDVRSLASSVGHARIAIVVPRFQHTAVARNRVKRRLRELVRRELLPRVDTRDILIRANRSTYAASFDELRASMRHVAGRFSPAA
jgi:ribonuclease P protein component